jgi:hypothetical protein
VIERTERLHNGWEEEGFVNWLKKVFASKPNTSNTMTSQEFGDFLFGLCIDGISSFMLSLDSPELRVRVEFTDKKMEINQIELLIAFMWLFFDRMQNPKYAKGFTRFHSRFMAHIDEAGLEESETWQLLQRRYDEYRRVHRSQGAVDNTYGKIAHEIQSNILGLDVPSVGVVFWHFLTASIQEHMIASGNLIKQIQIQDM